MKKLFLSFIVLSFFALSLPGQEPVMGAAEIFLEMQKLNTLKRVLYIAAHPDDENTRLIAYFSKEAKARTAYLSLTRGDGGQNLIGSEKSELMGLLRTNELLEARKIDGGEQFFTRAVDFGYSKNFDETLNKWDKDKVLADVVWAIRKFKPDVLITRFPPNNYGGHGHHSTSAILAEEAFDLAAKKNVYPEQLKYVEPWQPKRLYFNSSSWWDKELPEKVKAEPESYVTIDVGTYNELLGKSYAEIAAESRTMHKSQGFGSSKPKGTKLEYLKYVKGERATENDIFDGVNTDWSKVNGGADIQKLLEGIVANYDFRNPARSVEGLTKLHGLIQNCDNPYWKTVKLRDLERIILSCMGFYSDLTAPDYEYTEGDSINLSLFAINRSSAQVKLNHLIFQGQKTEFKTNMENNQPEEKTIATKITSYESPQPYWLRKPFGTVYQVDDQRLIGKPLNDPGLSAKISLSVNNINFDIPVSVNHKRTDPVKGEVFRPVHVLPEATANMSQKIFTFKPGVEQSVKVIIKAHDENVSGSVTVRLPKGWKSEEKTFNYSISEQNGIQEVEIKLTPGKKAVNGSLELLHKDGSPMKSLIYVEYDHITTQTVLPVADARLVILDLVTERNKIGYINGAGDEIPAALVDMGYDVTFIDEKVLETESLDGYEAIVTGIRAFNKHKFLAQYHQKLMDYVKSGGNLVVQYNKSYRLAVEQIGPYPMKLGRGRVTVEESEPTLLDPEHQIFNSPNKITIKDFEGWVQERGLYFAEEWDEDKYEALISWNDPGEDEEKGGLIVTRHGKGTFIYTGISFFRELPAGVSGAYKLLANLIEYK